MADYWNSLSVERRKRFSFLIRGFMDLNKDSGRMKKQFELRFFRTINSFENRREQEIASLQRKYPRYKKYLRFKCHKVQKSYYTMLLKSIEFLKEEVLDYLDEMYQGELEIAYDRAYENLQYYINRQEDLGYSLPFHEHFSLDRVVSEIANIICNNEKTFRLNSNNSCKLVYELVNEVYPDSLDRQTPFSTSHKHLWLNSTDTLNLIFKIRLEIEQG